MADFLDTYMDMNFWIHTLTRLIGFIQGTALVVYIHEQKVLDTH